MTSETWEFGLPIVLPCGGGVSDGFGVMVGRRVRVAGIVDVGVAENGSTKLHAVRNRKNVATKYK